MNVSCVIMNCTIEKSFFPVIFAKIDNIYKMYKYQINENENATINCQLVAEYKSIPTSSISISFSLGISQVWLWTSFKKGIGRKKM